MEHIMSEFHAQNRRSPGRAGFCDIEIRADRLWSGSLHPRSLLAATVGFSYRQMLKLVYFVERPGESRPSVYISPCTLSLSR